jgi:lysozyme family protein
MAKQYALATLAPEYRRLWETVEITNRDGAFRDARRIIANKTAYLRVERETGVPWFVVGAKHLREAGLSFTRWLHNGDPMRDKSGRPLRTTHVPANRPPDPSVDWFGGAYDALVTLKGYDKIKVWGPEHVAYAGESYNGFGYRNPSINIPSPYLWGGTNHQQRGKYIADGVYSRTAWDTQIGVMAVIKAIMELDSSAKFGGNYVVVPNKPAPQKSDKAAVPSVSPKAKDGPDVIRPVSRSRTIWATLGGWLASAGSVAVGAFQSLNNPYALAAFALVFVTATVTAFLVLRNYQKIIKLVHHLAPDDAEDEVQIVDGEE